MRKFLFWLLVIGIAVLGFFYFTSLNAKADEAKAPVVMTGSNSGTYFGTFGPKVAELLQNRKFKHIVAESAGAGENYLDVCANPRDVGLGQADILPGLAAAHPDCAGKVQVVNTIGAECLFGVTSVTDMTNIDQVADISFNLTIAVPPEGSGARLTWQNLIKTVPNLADATIIDAKSAADAIDLVKQGQADMAMFVSFPDPDNKIFKTVNDAKLTFVDMSNEAILQQTLPDGNFTYDRLPVTVANAGWKVWKGSNMVETACTKTVIFTGVPAANDRFQTTLVKMLSEAEPKELQPQVGWLQSVMNSAADTSRDKMLAAAQAAKQFAEEHGVTLN